MSLINEMLSDLNAQKKQKTPNISSHVSSSSFNSNNTALPKRALFGFSLFVIINLVIILSVYVNKLDYLKIAQTNPTIKQWESKAKEIATQKQPKEKKQVFESVLPLMTQNTYTVKPETKIPLESSANLITKKEEHFFIKKYKKLSKRQKSKKNYLLAMSMLDDNKVEDSILLLSKIIASDPSYVLPRESLAKVLLDLNRSKAALKIAEQGLKLFPSDHHFIEVKASIYLSKGDTLKALTLLQETAPLIDDAPDYYNLMAVAFEKLNQLSKAGAIYQKLVQASPDKGAYWLGYALSLEEDKKVNQAVNAYLHAVEAYDSAPIIISYARDRISALRG